MNKFEEVIEKCKQQMKDHNIDCDAALLEAVAKGLGPSIYNADSSVVSTTQQSEVDTVKNSFIKGKLGVDDEAAADAAIAYATEALGSSNKNKLRPVFYYLLTKKLGKESVYS